MPNLNTLATYNYACNLYMHHSLVKWYNHNYGVYHPSYVSIVCTVDPQLSDPDYP